MVAKKKKEMNKPIFAVNKQPTIDWYIVLILLAILLIVPMLNRMVPLNHAGPNITGSILDSGQRYEFASYYKFVWLLIGTVLLLAAFIYKLVKENYVIPFNYTYLLTGILFAVVMASGAFAPNKTISLIGHWDRHEGTLTFLSYLIVFFIAANLVYPAKKINWLFYILYPLTIINAALILIYFYGYNILHSSFMLSLLLPPELSASGLSPDSYINSTFGNPDFASGFGGMVTVLFLTRAILAEKTRDRAINLCFAVLGFAIILGSLATSGFFTLTLMLPVIIVLLFLSPRRKQGALTGLAALLAFSLVFVILLQQNPVMWDKSLGFFVNKLHNSAVQQPRVNPGNSAVTAGSSDSDEFNLPPAGWAPGTGRVYIWKRTLELVKERPILGYGLDNLPYFFPQDDPEKNSGINSPDTIVDKPHNFYLGIAFGSGVIAFLLFLAILLRHFWLHCRLFKTGLKGERRIVLASLFTGWCAYLIQALFNDSTIGVSIVFWILFGAGVSILQAEITEGKQTSVSA